MLDSLAKYGEPSLRALLCMGGLDMKDQVCLITICIDFYYNSYFISIQSSALQRGVHIVVATPGKLIDMLEKKRITLDVCR